MLFLLFAAYNIVQYVVINQWMMKQEEAAIQKNMTELQNYFQEKHEVLDAAQLLESKSYLEKWIQKNQLIRILDQHGNAIITVSNELPADWVAPRVSGQTTLTSLWHLQDHLLILRSPLISPQFQGTIEIVNNLEIFDQFNNVIMMVMVVGGIVAMAVSGLGGFVLVRQLLKPVQSLAETIRNVKKKGLQERVQLTENRDELSHLARMFNELMDQLETSFRQQKQFVEDASHELRTPIAIIEGHLSLLNRWGKNDPVILEESLAASLQEAQRLRGIVHELLQLTRSESEASDAKIESVDLVPIIEQTVKRLAMLHPDMSFESMLDAIYGQSIEMAPHHLEQILLIILDNAVKYSFERKNVRILGTKDKDLVHIQIADSGIGIPEDELPHVFDRFYRVDKARSRERGGTGLGLAIAKRLVERNRGRITVTSVENHGTTVKISFPLR
jgi:two-component system, OmpR family, sensor histidine kinase ArlS